MRNLLYLLIIFLPACVEPIDLGEESNVTNSLVVEGGITTELKHHQVMLSRTHAATGRNLAEPATGATATIYSDNAVFPLVETSPGIYETAEQVAGIIDNVYTLEVLYNDQVYRASDSLVKVVPQDGIHYYPIPPPPVINDYVTYFEFIYRDNFGVEVPYRYSVQAELDPNLQAYYPADWQPPNWLQRRLDNEDYITADSTYYLHTAIELPGILSYGETNETRLLYGSRITERYMSVSEKHYEFIRAFMSETEWKTLGPFGYVEGNVPSNVSNGGQGYFYASDVYTIVQVIPPE